MGSTEGDANMIITPVNEAEAIVDAFWDGGSSEHPQDKISLLSQYTISIPDGTVGSVEQIWLLCAYNLSARPLAPL